MIAHRPVRQAVGNENHFAALPSPAEGGRADHPPSPEGTGPPPSALVKIKQKSIIEYSSSSMIDKNRQLLTDELVEFE